MKKIVFLSLILLGFSFSSFSQVSAFSGKWKEIWGYGERSDVTYNDVFVISVVDGNKLEMTVPDKPAYSVRDIDVKGDTLSFTVKNIEYLMPYKLVLDNTKSVFWGNAKNIHGDNVTIKWEKMPE